MMPPILKEVKKQLGDKIRILKIDVDKNPSIAQKHQIQSVPTMMVLKWKYCISPIGSYASCPDCTNVTAIYLN